MGRNPALNCLVQSACHGLYSHGPLSQGLHALACAAVGGSCTEALVKQQALNACMVHRATRHDLSSMSSQVDHQPCCWLLQMLALTAGLASSMSAALGG